jgi:hypothetical protein
LALSSALYTLNPRLSLGNPYTLIKAFHLPMVDYGYRFGYDTNLNLKTVV